MENLSPQIIRQVAKEIIALKKDPPEGVKVLYEDEDITDIQAVVEGPGTASSHSVTCLSTHENVSFLFLFLM